jgi:hypothetical protein
LWDAANIINGYCSDDSFSHFRVGVIAQGGEVFYKALREPDTLAELPRNQAKSMIRCEYLDYGPSLVYQERFPGSEEDFDSGLGPAEPYGGDFKDTELLLRQYYPRLFEKYWNDNIQSDEEAEV